MHLKKLMVFSGLIISLSGSLAQCTSYVIIHPQEDAIIAHRDAIKRSFLLNKIARYCIKGAGVTASLYFGYKIVSTMNLFAAKIPSDAAVASSAVAYDALTQSKLEGVVKAVEIMQQEISPSFLSKKWFKNMGIALSEHLMAGLVATRIIGNAENCIADIFHPGSIGWYVTTKTNVLSPAELLPIVVPLDMVMQNAAMLSQFGIDFQQELSREQKAQLGKYAALSKPYTIKKSIFDELKSYVNQIDASGKTSTAYFIASGCNSLARQLELILGFMAYKYSIMSSDSAREQGLHILHTLKHEAKNLCNVLQHALQDEAIDGTQKKHTIESALNSFKADFGRLLITFSRIESEQRI